MGGYDTNRGSTKYCNIVNNTLYHNDTLHEGNGELNLQYDTQNNVINNNILYANSQNLFISNAYTANTANEVDYNAYYSIGGANGSEWQWKTTTYASFSDWQNGTGHDAHSIFSDPQLANPALGDLHLDSHSPAKDRGTNLSSEVRGDQDIDGDARIINAIIDIGADEVGVAYLLWTSDGPPNVPTLTTGSFSPVGRSMVRSPAGPPSMTVSAPHATQ